MAPSPRQLQAVWCIFLLLSLMSVLFVNGAAATDASSLPDVAAAKLAPGRLICRPCSMNFGKVRVGQSKALPVVLVNEGKTPIRISSKDKHAPWISPRGLVLPYTLQPGRRVTFHLVFHPRDARRVSGRIAYHSNAQNSLLPISVTGGTTTGGTLAANPARLDFGNVAVGNTATKTQTITNVGNTNVTLEQVTESGSGFSIGSVTTPQNLAPGHSVTFPVTFAPQKSGADSGSVITLSSATDYRLSVVTTGAGTAGGSVSITPSSLAFGNVPVGASKSKTLTLTATGTTMSINSDSLSSSEYSISGLALPLKLPAGKSVSFQATFAPQTAGSANGNLSLVVASPTSTLKASLSGNGTGGSQHSVSLTWKPDSSSVAGYNVYRGGKASGPYVKLTSPLDTATDYLDTSVTAGTTYYYEVTAVNDQGAESAPSAPVGATIP